jgi:hypothetical protein
MQKISSVLVLILLTFLGIEGFSQATTTSPYSRFGIGLLRPESFNQNFALGGTGIGLRSFNNINLINPASYSEVTITCFEIAATNNALWLSDGKQTQYNNNPHINYLAFAFPVISNKWGMAFGAKPYSSIGYNYNTIKADSIAGNVSYYYQGDGGITKAFFGNALKFKIDSTSSISAGHNLSFLFGNINEDKKIILGSISNAFNLWEVTNSHVADFTSDFGLQYQKTFTNVKDEKYFLTIGATYALGADLNTKTTHNVRTFTGNIDFGEIKDTVEYVEDAKDVTSIPATIGGGIALEKDKKWTVALDFKTINYGDIASIDPTIGFKNNYTISSGFEFIPKYDAFNNYFKRIKYKFGARYSTAYLSINNTDITEYGITFGIVLPIKRTDTSIPGLNLGIEYGNRGVESNGLVKETFVNFNVGITINDRWFIKRKYD